MMHDWGRARERNLDSDVEFLHEVVLEVLIRFPGYCSNLSSL